MEMELTKTFRFEAAHRLPNFPEGHKCKRLHGHSYQVDVKIEGEISKNTGVVMDYQDISDAFAPILKDLDHYYLNEVRGLENPTSENLAKWIWERLKPTLPMLKVVIVRETCTSGCSYFGP